MCTCISRWIYVHLTPILVQPLCIVWWKPGCPCLSLCMCPSHPTCGPTPCLECVHASVQEFMSTWLLSSGPALCILWCQVGCPCMGACLCPSHLISDPTPCLECVHASVHKFMSTLLLILAQPPMDSYIEGWVPLCFTVCVCVPVTLLVVPHFV